MIRNIKTFNNLAEEIEGVKSSVAELKEEFSGLKSDISGLKETMQEFREEVGEHTKIMHAMASCKDEVAQMRDELSREIYDFKLMKTQMSKQIMEKFDVEVRGALDRHLSRLEADADLFRKLKQDLSVTSSKVQEAGGELAKFNRIAKQIKEADFSLVRHAKKLEGMEREKLALMKKIDNLERMVSKARRSGGERQSRGVRN